MSISKNKESLYAHLGIQKRKQAMSKVDTILNCLDADEEILHAFYAVSVSQNAATTSYCYCMITNKKFLFSGERGQLTLAANWHMGTVELKDIHAFSSGKIFLQGEYVQFELKNENYRIFSNQLKASELLPILKNACERAKKAEKSATTSNVSAADELKKFKELLDMGVISQEEFDAKKKQLLGL